MKVCSLKSILDQHLELVKTPVGKIKLSSKRITSCSRVVNLNLPEEQIDYQEPDLLSLKVHKAGSSASNNMQVFWCST